MASLPPPPPPWDPGFRLANWRGQNQLFLQFEECVGIEIFSDDDPHVRCLKCGSEWWPTFQPDGPHRAPLRGPGGREWWHCPDGCNTRPGAIPRAWEADITYVAERPPGGGARPLTCS